MLQSLIRHHAQYESLVLTDHDRVAAHIVQALYVVADFEYIDVPKDPRTAKGRLSQKTLMVATRPHRGSRTVTARS